MLRVLVFVLYFLSNAAAFAQLASNNFLGPKCPGAGALCQPVPVLTCSVTPPVDVLGTSAVVEAWGLRRLNSLYTANKAVNIRRASDNSTLDVGFASNGCDFNTTAASTFCTSTTCFVNILYGQVNGNNASQPVQGSQPGFNFSVIGGFPALQCLGSTLNSSTPRSFSSPFSVMAVAERTGNTGNFNVLLDDATDGNISVGWANATSTLFIGSVTGYNVSGVSENTFHSIQWSFNAASSFVSVDGTNTTGTAQGGTVAFPFEICNTSLHTSSSLTGDVVEVIVGKGALSTGVASTIRSNQKSYWGTP